MSNPLTLMGKQHGWGWCPRGCVWHDGDIWGQPLGEGYKWLEGDVLGKKWACIGMLTTIFLLFVTCGLGVITNVRHERR